MQRASSSRLYVCSLKTPKSNFFFINHCFSILSSLTVFQMFVGYVFFSLIYDEQKLKVLIILLIKKSVNNYGLPSGFERLVKVLEGKNSNYETSLFTPLTEYLENANGKKMKFLDCEDVDKQAFQTLLDHMRCLSVAITGTPMLLLFSLIR